MIKVPITGKATLRKTNIVILANNYNPSIVSRDWVLSKQLLSEPIGDFVHTPAFSLIENNDFSLVVDMNRLQLSTKRLSPENIRLMPQIIKKFFTLLPETPYRAMGFNFIYELETENNFLEHVLSPNKQSITKLFSAKYELGMVISFDFESFVTRVNISPRKLKGKVRTINFNFHTSIRGVEEAKKRLDSYEKTLEKVERTFKSE